MHTSRSVADIREHLIELKKQDIKICLVPTMGALHEGHLSLIRLARKHSDIVVVSIYVNPTQFGPGEDFNAYPRTETQDLKACETEGVDVVFIPGTDEVYAETNYIGFTVDTLADHLCGPRRQHHFPGVLQIVNKLFNIIQPHAAVFGQKDIQQFRIIERMRDEFSHPIELIRAPIIRDSDGLALSSRNSYLTAEQRNKAPLLYQSLNYIADRIDSGEQQLTNTIEDRKRFLAEKGFQVEYIQCVDSHHLQPVTELKAGGEYIIAGAVHLGATRLIDNFIVEANDPD